MLLAELQGGGSGASGAEVDLEQLRKEQENYEKLLVRIVGNGAIRGSDLSGPGVSQGALLGREAHTQ